MGTDKLKLGLIIESLEVPAWLFHSLAQLARSDFAEFSAIFLINDDKSGNNTFWFHKVWENRRNWLYGIFNRIDEKIFVRGRNACEMMNLRTILDDVNVVPVQLFREGNADGINSDEIKRIQAFHLDILINLMSQRLSGEIVSAADYGIWYYEHQDNRVKRGGPPGFWEVVERWPNLSSTLLSANEFSPDGWIVHRSFLLAYPFSPARTRNISLWASSSFLPRQIRLLHRIGKEDFFRETAKFNSPLDLYDRRKYQTPTNWDSVKLYTRLFFRNGYELLQRAIRKESWCLLFDLSNNTSLTFTEFKKVAPPKDRFWADPMVIKKEENFYIFVEEYFYKSRKGHISVIVMDLQGKCKDAVPVLETKDHLSYPFVFEYDHTYYMVPESSQNRRIDLYECIDFPIRWKFRMTLMENVIAVDTTLFFYLGKWWLFTGITENQGASPEVELFLFSSDTLFTSEWKSHPQNPVISDVTCARPAGRLFTLDGKIYRPSQDCSKNYGYGFNINEVLCLTETEYWEKKVATVKPNWDSRLVATHTFTRAEGINIIDVATRRIKMF